MNEKPIVRKPRPLIIYLAVIIVSIILILLAFKVMIHQETPIWNNLCFSDIDPISSTEVKMTFGGGFQDLDPDELLLTLTSDNQQIDITFILINNSKGYMAYTSNLDVNVSFFDLNPANLLLNIGDYLVIKGLNPDCEYQIEGTWLVTNQYMGFIYPYRFIMPPSE